MKVSVALCTYNGEKFIKEQLESILSQKLEVDEIIICDDGSSDSSWAIITEFEHQYPDIFRVFKNESTLGVIKNFEKAINLCTGDVIFLCDQDDIWFSNKITSICNYLLENPHIEAVFHNYALLEKGEVLPLNLWDALLFDDKIQRLTAEELTVHALLVTNVLTGAAFAFRRDHVVFSQNMHYLHDAQLLFKYAERQTLGHMSEILGYYRIHDAQQIGVETSGSKFLQYRYSTLYSSKNFYNLYLSYREAASHLRSIPNKTESMLKALSLLKKWYQQRINIHAKQYGFFKRPLVRLKWLIKQ